MNYKQMSYTIPKRRCSAVHNVKKNEHVTRRSAQQRYCADKTHDGVSQKRREDGSQEYQQVVAAGVKRSRKLSSHAEAAHIGRFINMRMFKLKRCVSVSLKRNGSKPHDS